MRIAIATIYNADYAPICAVTDENKQDYAFRHGYDYLPQKCAANYRSIFFFRHKWYLDVLRDYHCLLCCDGDVIFTNFTIPIEPMLHESDCVIIAKDALMIQAGVFLVRNSEAGRRFLHCIAQGESEFRNAPGFDQSAMVAYFKQHPEIVRIVPQRELQSYEYDLYKDLGGNYAKGLDADGNDGQWQVGDYALHVPAVPDQKLKVLKEHLSLVVK